MRKIIHITQNLKELFPKRKKPLIVTNIGGFTMDSPLTEKGEKVFLIC